MTPEPIREPTPKEKATAWAVSQQNNATCRIDPAIIETIVEALSK